MAIRAHRMIGKIVEKGLREYGGSFPATVGLSWGTPLSAMVYGVRAVGGSEVERQDFEVLMDVPVVRVQDCVESGPSPDDPTMMRAWIHERHILMFASKHYRLFEECRDLPS